MLLDLKLRTSLPVVCCYGPNNCGNFIFFIVFSLIVRKYTGKTIRMNAYSSACGVRGGKNKSKFKITNNVINIKRINSNDSVTKEITMVNFPID